MELVMVANGCIMLDRKNMLTKDDVIDSTLLEEKLSKKEIDRYLQDGWLIPVSELRDKLEQEARTAAEAAAREAHAQVATATEKKDEKAPAAPQDESTPDTRFPTKWAFTHEALAGKTLADLNILISEQAARMKVATPEVFNTVEEATAFLTQDL